MPLIGHKKSRRGCTSCKRRRVKCDENRPCRACARRNEQCSLLLTDATSLLGSQTSRRQSVEPSASVRTNVSLSPDPLVLLADYVGQPQALKSEDWSYDLYLMHHYSTSTCLTFSTRKDIQELWQTWIPEEAVTHQCLMHGLLAISARHLAHLRTPNNEKYLSLSNKHQSLALGAFRSVLLPITVENCNAFFALAALISVFSMSVSSCRTEPTLHSGAMSIDDIVELFVLTRGVREVVKPSTVWINNGPLKPMLYGHVFPEFAERALPDSLQLHFDDLRDMVRDHRIDLAVQRFCVEALAELEGIYKTLLCLRTDGDFETGVVWKFAIDVSSGYMTLIRDCQPAALIILAHFAILSGIFGNKWYIHGWSQQALQAIKNVLEPDWQTWLRWPEEQLARGLPILQIKGCHKQDCC